MTGQIPHIPRTFRVTSSALTGRFWTAHRQLLALADLADWAHGLAFARPGIQYRPGRPHHDPDVMPIRTRKTKGSPRIDVTAAADDAWANRWQSATATLVEADQLLVTALAGVTIRQPVAATLVITATTAMTPEQFQALCLNVDDGLILAFRHLPALRTKHQGTVTETVPKMVNAAHAKLPDTRDPAQPPTCDECGELLGDSRGKVCNKCRQRRSRAQRRAV